MEGLFSFHQTIGVIYTGPPALPRHREVCAGQDKDMTLTRDDCIVAH
jgi:hypothetical protein